VKRSRTKYYVKSKEYSYRHAAWHTVEELNDMFGVNSVRNKISNFKKKGWRYRNEQEAKYGPGVLFNPEFVEIDRIINWREELQVSLTFC